jgi:hypothetical protein
MDTTRPTRRRKNRRWNEIGKHVVYAQEMYKIIMKEEKKTYKN